MVEPAAGRAVADAAGGILGLGNRISSAEPDRLTALEQAFASSSPTVPLVRKTEFAYRSPDFALHQSALLPTGAGYAPVGLDFWDVGADSAGDVA